MSNALNLGNIILPGDGYPSLFGFQIPVVSGLEGAFLLGDGEAMLGKNYAPGKSDGVVIGTPTANSGYAAMSGSGYIDTGISETDALTLFAVLRDSSGTVDMAPGVIGNYVSGNSGASLYMGADYIRSGLARTGTTDGVSTGINPAIFSLVSARGATGIATRVKNWTAGSENSGTAITDRALNTAQTLKIGELPNASFAGPIDIGLAMIYSRVLTDVEMDQMAAWARSYCAAKGITV